MRKYLNTIFIIAAGIYLSACSTTQIDKFNQASANYRAVVLSINMNIQATAPLVARACGDLQSAAFLLAPLVPKNAKAPQYFAAANAALNAYCQTIPLDIASTAKAVASAVTAAKQGYDKAVGR